MQICRGCSRNIPDSRFCPECGRDQTVLFPTENQLPTDRAVVRRDLPPSPPRIIDTATQNAYPPPPPGNPAPSGGYTPDWLKGMAYSFGGCVFLSLMAIFGLFVFAVLVASCLAVGDAGAPAAPPPSSF